MNERERVAEKFHDFMKHQGDEIGLMWRVIMSGEIKERHARQGSPLIQWLLALPENPPTCHQYFDLLGQWLSSKDAKSISRYQMGLWGLFENVNFYDSDRDDVRNEPWKERVGLLIVDQFQCYPILSMLLAPYPPA